MDNPAPVRKFRELFENWISLAGAVVAIGSFFAFILLFGIDLFAHDGNPYMGILAYVVAPGFLVIGLAVMAFGAFLEWRYEHKHGAGTKLRPIMIDLTQQRDRKILFRFALGALLFIMVTAFGSYQTYEFTDSVAFCGEACHTPMKPEYVAYQHSPHAKIKCSECHVGHGAEFYLKAKLNGVHQLVATLTDSYERPIPTPVKNLRPAQDTCETCHWPNRYAGNQEKTYERFLADEDNTSFTLRMVLNVGGGDAKYGRAGGIHWHMNIANKIEYIAEDDRKQIIPWVRFTDHEGNVKEFRSYDFEGDPADHELHVMDCMDCHNRPAHRYVTPNNAVDDALSFGLVDREMPWVKSNLVAVLTAEYATEEEALESIESKLSSIYAGHESLSGLVRQAKTIFSRNFFPEMKADWRAYPDNSSHKDWPGCFRCHDGMHESPDDGSILSASDCNSCHVILAQGTGEELMDLNPEGHAFFHIDSTYEDFSCADCHNGQLQIEEEWEEEEEEEE